jgi:hypothetical protein
VGCGVGDSDRASRDDWVAAASGTVTGRAGAETIRAQRPSCPTTDGPVRIQVLRNRAGTFEPQIIRKYEHRETGFDRKIGATYARSMTVRETQGSPHVVNDTKVSPEVICEVTDGVQGFRRHEDLRLLPRRFGYSQRTPRVASLSRNPPSLQLKMRYWWVNQNQTFRQEFQGGYLWSPKRKANGNRNPFYDFMREVAPGDVVFSFADTRIAAIGLVASNAYEAPKPVEFGQTGMNWDKIGWRADVRFVRLLLPIRPADYMSVLAPLLPRQYAPLTHAGTGLQGIYLTILPDPFAFALVDLLGAEAHVILNNYRVASDAPVQPAVGLVEWEEHELQKVQADPRVPETERTAIVLARRGQGLFKERVNRIERACRITGVDRIEHLRASHCKPWRDATNEERLDGENGLLLTPNADHLFDRGFIGFEDNGDVLVSPVAHTESLARMGINPASLRNVGRFSQGQRAYLAFQRDNVLLKSRYLGGTRIAG